MLDRLTRIQLAIFAVVTVITVVIMAIFYLRLPAALGIGTYHVTANFVAGETFRSFESYIVVTVCYLILAAALRRFLTWLGPRFIFGH